MKLNIQLFAGEQPGISIPTPGTLIDEVALDEYHTKMKSYVSNEIPTNVSAFTNDAGYTTNTGTITSVKMNGSTIASSGEADLGTVITSHQSIKTINNTSLVGTGNITLSTFSGSYNDLTNKPTIPSKTSDLQNDSGYITSSYHDSSKQDTLVSGTNIKTINNTSLLGSGNITIGGGGTATDVQINGTSITSGGTANILTNGTYSSSNKIATMSDIPSVPTTVSSFTNDAGYITSSDLPQDSGWITITPTNGTAGTGYYVPQYRKIGKLVTMRGYIIVKNNQAMFNLPTTYRPSARLTFAGTNDNRNVNEIRVVETGDVRLLGTTGNFSNGVPCFLDNVSYFVD